MKKTPDFCCHGDCQQSRLCPRTQPVNLKYPRSLSDAFTDERANSIQRYKPSLSERFLRWVGLWGLI
jgi:hypothetical protein